MSCKSSERCLQREDRKFEAGEAIAPKLLLLPWSELLCYLCDPVSVLCIISRHWAFASIPSLRRNPNHSGINSSDHIRPYRPCLLTCIRGPESHRQLFAPSLPTLHMGTRLCASGVHVGLRFAYDVSLSHGFAQSSLSQGLVVSGDLKLLQT